MIAKNTQKLIVKYLNKQATLSERDDLEMWLEDSNNFKLFKDYVKINYLVMLTMDMFDTDNTKKQLKELIVKEKKVVRLRKRTRFMKYAAIVVVF